MDKIKLSLTTDELFQVMFALRDRIDSKTESLNALKSSNQINDILYAANRFCFDKSVSAYDKVCNKLGIPS